MNALWRAVTRTRTMRSAAADFGPPPGARYADDLAALTDAELVLYGEQVVARVRDRQHKAFATQEATR